MGKQMKKKLNHRMIFSLIINLILIVSTAFLINYILKLNGIENLLRIVFSIVISLCVCLILIFNIKTSKKKKSIGHKLLVLISIVIIIANAFLGYSLAKVFNTLNKISNNTGVTSVSLVTLKSNNIKDISKITSEDKIASISNEISDTLTELVQEFTSKNKIKNELEYYDTYFEIADALLKEKVKYAFLPTEYQSILSSQEGYSDFSDKVSVIKSYKKSHKAELTPQKSVLEPFTVLLMGVDTLTSSYNADTLMVVTFNPETLSATMLSIPRDTYTTISCTGRKHKINSSGWSGDKCVISTVEKYLDIDIDYYAKINFKGAVQLVDSLGGIEVDVPYSFCEQNSERKWGKKTIYVEKGVHTLDGEQALALTRNRHYWKGRCDSKYTSEGNRSDFKRGQNQQLVIKSMLNSVKKIDDISTIYKLLDTLGDNMVTNMSTDTILSLYNVGKDILIKMNTTDSDISQLLNIKRLKFTSYTKVIKIGNLNLDTVINYEDSVKETINAMKVNLNLLESKPIKTFEFDINNKYEEDIVGSGVYSGNSEIVVLPNFVGKKYEYAQSWTFTNDIDLKIEYESSTDPNYSEGEIIEQSVKPNTDISTIKKLTITVVTKKAEENNEPSSEQKFSYKQCLEEENKDHEKCIIKSFVGTDIKTFKNWVLETGLDIPIEYNEVEGVNSNIIGQNLTGLTLYEIINQGKKLEITYSKPGEPVNNEEPSKEDNEEQAIQ